MITVNQMENWLDNHDKDYRRNGVQEIFDTWMVNKAGLYERMKKHPNWDEDANAIVLKESQYNRGFNQKAIKTFNDWACKEINKVLAKVEKYQEVGKISDELTIIQNAISVYERHMIKAFKVLNANGFIDDEPMIYPLREKRDQLNKEANKYMVVNGYDVEKAIGEKYEKVIKALNVCKKATDYLMTKEMSNEINSIVDVKAVEGQKLSRVIRKICCTVGLEKVQDIHEYGTYTRDEGFNREFAMLCDEINPIQYKRITVISIDPRDFWSMSHGKKWKSCHYVGDGDDGCYSSGTESYMLDEVSVIYYIIDEEYEGKDYWSQQKERRCVFSIHPDGDMILESRVYPDGRDGGDDTLAGQFRTVMQKIVSELWEKNNYWYLKKGKEKCIEYTTEPDGATHYADYHFCDDCNVSINRDIKDEKPKKITIGHTPICPVCGEKHVQTKNILCDDCNNNYKTCGHCGSRIEPDDAIYCVDNGCYYCDSECAGRDDVYYCEDDYEYHDIDNCFYDDYLGWYHSGEPEVEAEDGCKFASYDNAFAADYEQDYYTGDWYDRNDLIYCEDEGVDINPNNGDYVVVNDKYFTSAEKAEYYGYHEAEDGEWYSDDDLIRTEDDTYYSSEEAAKEAGYIENEYGDWVMESEVA